MKVFINILLVWLIALIFLGLSLLSIGVVSAAGQGSPHSTSLETSNPYYKLLADFKTSEEYYCNKAHDGWIDCSISENEYVIIVYDVSTPTVMTKVTQAWLSINLNMDLSAWDSVWIVVKGKNGGEELYAEFTDCNQTVFPKVKISDYLTTTGITTYWRAAAIPLDAFNDQAPPDWSWSCIGRFNIVANSELPSGSGTVHVDEVALLASTVLIDDFHDQELENELGGASGFWCDLSGPPCNPTGIITPTFPSGTLKLSYNVVPSNTSGGYWTKLISTNLLSQKATLFLNVRGEQSGEEILVEFKDCGTGVYTHYPKIKISDYLDSGITTNWRTVAIPLAAFVDAQAEDDPGPDWSCADTLAFNVYGQPRYNSGRGAVYIDDVRLVPANASIGRVPVIVDRFLDCDHWNALNWQWIIGGELTASGDRVNRLGNYGCGYKLAYTVTLETSGYVWAELKGLDLTGYDQLQFYLKGTTGNEVMRVYLGDRDKKQHDKPITTTNSWRLVRTPLSDFKLGGDVAITNLAELKFAFEQRVETSEVYVDDITFTQLWTTSLPIILKSSGPTKLYIKSENTGGISHVDILDPNNGDALLLSCGPIGDNVTEFCGNFEPVGTYKLLAYTVRCGLLQDTFNDAVAGATVTRRVFCN